MYLYIYIFLLLFFVESKGGSKMTDEKIIEYVMDSPENTNPSVLDSMLKSNKVQPDWNQNDSTASDYIKNRPFYEEIIEGILLPRRALSVCR